MAIVGEKFPQTRDARKSKLGEIRRGDAISTAKIPGKGVKSVYRIPLEYLSYNPHNTRFLAQAKTLEKRFGTELSDENPDHIAEIERIIWKQKQDKNESTIASLIKDGQLQPGVVTADGIILSGNRRFRLLNEISRNRDSYRGPGVNLDGLQYFEAVILEGELDKKEIVRYESFYQYGTEDKVEYDPIQKYLAAHEQEELGFTTKDIAENFMAITEGKESEVKKWLEVFEIMEEYLEYIGEPGIYTALEGREEAFLRLRSELIGFSRGRAGNDIWAFEEFDLGDMKRVFFDYIRLNEIPTHDFREFRKIFSEEKRWKNFSKAASTTVESNEIPTFDEYRQQHADLDENEVSKIRSRDYEEKVGKHLKQLFGNEKARNIGEDVEKQPLGIVSAIQDKVAKLETFIEQNPRNNVFTTDEFLSAVRDLQSRIGKIKQRID